ncbi:TRI47 protein, partial [Polypterus senegalus]
MMAEANISLSQEEFTCSVCLELLKDPASTACGHNFCLDCIQQYWDQNSNMGVFSCPQCRQTFSPRPVLGRNATLVEIVERFKKTMPSHPLPKNHTTPGDVLCDFCSDKTIPAVKSCLTCTASYCESHIKPHYDVLALKAHLLVNARQNLWERICPAHQKVIDIFCRTDQISICCYCAMTEHKSHDTVISKAEREKKQSHLNMKQTEIHHRIEERLQKLAELKEGMEAFKRSAQKEIGETEKFFTELIHSIETTCKKIIEMIKDNENAEVKKSEGVMEQLENDISALRKRSKELTELSETDDDIIFLQNYPTLSTLPGNEELSDISFCSHFSVAALTRHKDDLKSAVEKLCNWELQTVTQDGCKLCPIPPDSRLPAGSSAVLYITLDPEVLLFFLPRDLPVFLGQIENSNSLVSPEVLQSACPRDPLIFLGYRESKTPLDLRQHPLEAASALHMAVKPNSKSQNALRKSGAPI